MGSVEGLVFNDGTHSGGDDGGGGLGLVRGVWGWKK